MKHATLFDEEIELAKTEAPITQAELLQEIFPLMQEYFVGQMKCDRNSILYRLPNGQCFRITAKQE